MNVACVEGVNQTRFWTARTTVMIDTSFQIEIKAMLLVHAMSFSSLTILEATPPLITALKLHGITSFVDV